MTFIFNMLILAVISGVVIGVIISICNKKNDTSTHERESIIIKPTITTEFSVSENSFTEIAPDYIRIPHNANCHEYNKGGIGFLNYQTYSYSARYVETNRMRKRTIDVFDNCDVKSQILSQGGYTDPISYEPIIPDPATENQLSYINSLIEETSCTIEVPLDKLSSLDASGIIYYLTEGGHTPSADIVKYSGELHIKASYCFPDWLVFQNIWNKLSQKNRISFFIFCVYRDKYPSTCDDPSCSPHKNIFTSFAEQYRNNEKFLSSMQKNYVNGHDLVRFGRTVTRDSPYRGGSKQTTAYKLAIEFLDKNL